MKKNILFIVIISIILSLIYGCNSDIIETSENSNNENNSTLNDIVSDEISKENILDNADKEESKMSEQEYTEKTNNVKKLDTKEIFKDLTDEELVVDYERSNMQYTTPDHLIDGLVFGLKDPIENLKEDTLLAEIMNRFSDTFDPEAEGKLFIRVSGQDCEDGKYDEGDELIDVSWNVEYRYFHNGIETNSVHKLGVSLVQVQNEETGGYRYNTDEYIITFMGDGINGFTKDFREAPEITERDVQIAKAQAVKVWREQKDYNENYEDRVYYYEPFVIYDHNEDLYYLKTNLLYITENDRYGHFVFTYPLE